MNNCKNGYKNGNYMSAYQNNNNDSKPSKPRINKYDNLRGLAILLVIFGHMIYSKFFPFGITRDFVFLIDLPLLYFVSGFFSKIGPDEGKKAFKRILLPYIIFCIIDALVDIFIYNKNPKMLFIYPGFGLWFLLALFFMKMTLPIFDKLKHPITISIILFLLVGFLDIQANFFGITRFLKYMPMFLLGYYFKDYKSKFEEIMGKRNLKWNNKYILLIIGLIITLIAAYLIPYKIIAYSPPYASLDFKLSKQLMYRVLMVLASMVAVLVLNNSMHNKNNFLTKLGKNSMAIYIFHLYLYSPWQPISEMIFTKFGPLASISASIIISLLIALIFSRDIFTEIYNKLMDISYDFIMKIINLIK